MLVLLKAEPCLAEGRDSPRVPPGVFRVITILEVLVPSEKVAMVKVAILEVEAVVITVAVAVASEDVGQVAPATPLVLRPSILLVITLGLEQQLSDSIPLHIYQVLSRHLNLRDNRSISLLVNQVVSRPRSHLSRLPGRLDNLPSNHLQSQLDSPPVSQPLNHLGSPLGNLPPALLVPPVVRPLNLRDNLSEYPLDNLPSNLLVNLLANRPDSRRRNQVDSRHSSQHRALPFLRVVRQDSLLDNLSTSPLASLPGNLRHNQLDNQLIPLLGSRADSRHDSRRDNHLDHLPGSRRVNRHDHRPGSQPRSHRILLDSRPVNPAGFPLSPPFRFNTLPHSHLHIHPVSRAHNLLHSLLVILR